MSESDDLDLVERAAAPLREPETVDATFEARLLSAARAAVARGEAPWQQPQMAVSRHPRRSWFTRPRQIGVSPIAGLAAAAAFAAVVVGATLVMSRRPGSDAPGALASAASPAREVVRFVIVAPAAKDVALVGDFNGWNASATPLVRDSAGGAWTVTVPLASGTYQYAFVVDGHAWVADPTAPVALADEFGAPSSLKIVGGRRT